MPVLLMFLLWPLAEIATFVAVGDRIGALNTILLVVASGVAGAMILRRQGVAALRSARNGPPPPAEVLSGMAAAFAGVLLLIPGFLSDVLAVALLIPGVRQVLGAFLLHRLLKSGGEVRAQATAGSRTAGAYYGPAGENADFSPGRPDEAGFSANDPRGGAVIDVEYTEVVVKKTDGDKRGLEDKRS